METLFTITSLADVLAVKPPTLRKWMREGLPHLKLGKLVRFRESEVSVWLETKRAKPAKPRLEYVENLPRPYLRKPCF